MIESGADPKVATMPGPWTRQRWLAATDVRKYPGLRPSRSPLLVALDDALHRYDTAAPMHRLAALARLWDAFDAWAAGKADPAASPRNRHGAVTALAAWLLAEEEATMPAPEGSWSGLVNCYAYAMKCALPGGGQTPVPGRAAGAAVMPYTRPPWPDRAAYWSALVDGVVADGQACARPVVVVSRPQGALMPQPDNPPVHRCTAHHYLVALVVKSDGFHFLRRDSLTGHWSHKNGAQDAQVETFASLTDSGRPEPLDDAVVVDLLRSGQGRYRSSFPNFSFAGYLLVPDAGLTVA